MAPADKTNVTQMLDDAPAFTRQTGGVFFVIKGPDRGESVPLREAPIYFGSSPNCDLVLTDKTVSRKHMQAELFSKPQFQDYARDNLVLVELDFPRAKEQTPEVRKQNRELAQQYEVVGFPTIVVLNSDGQTLWKFDGYFPGGLEAFIEQLQKIRKG